MKVVCLIDNNPSDPALNLERQHGLSIYIEHAGRKLLFDTGADEKFEKNARALNIDLSEVDAAIISHGHNDHAGGLPRFFEVNKKAKVFIHKSVPQSAFVKRSMMDKTDIGIDNAIFRSYSDRFVYIESSCEILPGASVLANIPNVYPKVTDSTLLCSHGKRFVKDDFSHEIALCIKAGPGYALFTGCSHCGIENHIAALKTYMEPASIAAVFGGFHLERIPNGLLTGKGKIKSLGKRLSASDVDLFYTGHCTGQAGYALLRGELKDRIKILATGRTVVI